MHTFAEDRYERMSFRRCGRSGLELPAISLGFWQSLAQPGKEDICRQCMHYAFDHGVTHFDLANNYGPPPGAAETIVGKILRTMPRDELIVSTKAGYYMWEGPYGEWGSKKYLVASLDQSLRRLGLEYVDIFYHHRPDPKTPLEETLGTLDLMVKQGKTLYVGVSNYRGKMFQQAVRIVRDHYWAPLTIHQPYYHMLDRWVEKDLLDYTEKAGTGVIPFSPLGEGVLTDRYLKGLPPDSRMGRKGAEGQRWYDDLQQRGVWDKVRALSQIAQARGQTTAQLAITWLLRDRRVTSVLIGASGFEQLKENLAAASAPPLSQDELKRIDQIIENGK